MHLNRHASPDSQPQRRRNHSLSWQDICVGVLQPREHHQPIRRDMASKHSRRKRCVGRQQRKPTSQCLRRGHHHPQQSSHLGREPPTHMVSDCEEECNKRQVVGFWQPGAERQPRKDAVAKLRLPHQHNASENRHRLPNLERFLTSWKSPNDPAQREFSVRLDSQGLPEFFLWQSSNRIWRSGPWNGHRFSGVPQMSNRFLYNLSFVSNENETYFTGTLYNKKSSISRMVLEASGQVQRQMWSNHRWNLFWVRSTVCDAYSQCGKNSKCNSDSDHEPPCECLRGFQPRSPQNWVSRDWSDGCGRRMPLKCGGGDGFFRLGHVKLPDTSRAREGKRGSRLKECEEECLKNCSYSSDLQTQRAGSETLLLDLSRGEERNPSQGSWKNPNSN
ncbi:hypothetical protein ACLOJK_020473 [Asimina triloba]